MAIDQKPIQSSFDFKTILSVILLVVAVVGLFMFVFPKKDAFADLQADIAQKETQLNRLKNDLTKFQSLEDSFEGGEVTEKDVLNSIPDEVEQGEVIETLAKYSEENEASINSLSFGLSQNKDGNYSTLSITTNVSGTHSNLINFLEALEKDARKFSVNTMSVQVLEGGLENMSLNIEAYFL